MADSTPAFTPPVGPVDIAVVGFPTAVPDPRVTTALHEAVASGAVRILDVLIVSKGDDGSTTVVDVDAVDETLEILGFPADLPGVLGEGDALDVGDELPPSTSALIIAWENVWAVRLRQAVDEAGGVVALHERVDSADVERASAAVLADA